MITLKKIDIPMTELNSNLTGLGHVIHLFPQHIMGPNDVIIDQFWVHDIILIDPRTLIICMAYYIQSDPEVAKDLDFYFYCVIDLDANKVDYYLENEGEDPECEDPTLLLANMFIGPDYQPYTLLEVNQFKKKSNVIIPLLNRQYTVLPYTVLPKSIRLANGDFKGVVNQSSIFYHIVDSVSYETYRQPDQLTLLKLKHNGVYTFRQNEIPLPKSNHFFIHPSNNEFHLLAPAPGEDGWLHRQIDEKGNIINSRIIKVDKGFYPNRALVLSFSETSRVLSLNGENLIYLITISPEGKIKQDVLFQHEHIIQYIHDSIQISEHTYVVIFSDTNYTLNWITIRHDEVIEGFIQHQDGHFLNVLTQETFQLSQRKLRILKIIKIQDDKYGIIFLYQHYETDGLTELIVMSRKID